MPNLIRCFCDLSHFWRIGGGTVIAGVCLIRIVFLLTVDFQHFMLRLQTRLLLLVKKPCLHSKEVLFADKRSLVCKRSKR